MSLVRRRCAAMPCRDGLHLPWGPPPPDCRSGLVAEAFGAQGWEPGQHDPVGHLQVLVEPVPWAAWSEPRDGPRLQCPPGGCSGDPRSGTAALSRSPERLVVARTQPALRSAALVAVQPAALCSRGLCAPKESPLLPFPVPSLPFLDRADVDLFTCGLRSHCHLLADVVKALPAAVPQCSFLCTAPWPPVHRGPVCPSSDLWGVPTFRLLETVLPEHWCTRCCVDGGLPLGQTQGRDCRGHGNSRSDLLMNCQAVFQVGAASCFPPEHSTFPTFLPKLSII